VGAITFGVTAGLADVGKKAISDAYHFLKSVITKKFGRNSKLADAVDELEKNAESDSQKQAVLQEVQLCKAYEDTDVLNAAQVLLGLLKAQGGVESIQSATGNYIAQAAGGSSASVKVRSNE
jgi:hypothetical protein